MFTLKVSLTVWYYVVYNNVCYYPIYIMFQSKLLHSPLPPFSFFHFSKVSFSPSFSIWFISVFLTLDFHSLFFLALFLHCLSLSLSLPPLSLAFSSLHSRFLFSFSSSPFSFFLYSLPSCSLSHRATCSLRHYVYFAVSEKFPNRFETIEFLTIHFQRQDFHNSSDCPSGQSHNRYILVFLEMPARGLWQFFSVKIIDLSSEKFFLAEQKEFFMAWADLSPLVCKAIRNGHRSLRSLLVETWACFVPSALVMALLQVDALHQWRGQVHLPLSCIDVRTNASYPWSSQVASYPSSVLA